MRKILLVIFCLFPLSAQSAAMIGADFAQKYAGRILLQVEDNGEAWYVDPSNYKRHYLGRPEDAFKLMRSLGIGITNDNLAKIPIGLYKFNDLDNDGDGLENRLEAALGTDANKADTDGDGYSDKQEAENNFNPNGSGRIGIDWAHNTQISGKIYLQVQGHGEAWYINPVDNKRYYLGRPADAFAIMRQFGLGITNTNLNQIIISSQYSKPPKQLSDIIYVDPNNDTSGADNPTRSVMDAAGNAIISGDNDKALSYFNSDLKYGMEYTLNFLDSEGRFTLGNMLLGSEKYSSAASRDIYTADFFFNNQSYSKTFYVEKQSDGEWLITKF